VITDDVLDLEERIPEGYYAIPDPHDPTIVSRWHMTKPDRNGRCHLNPWPPKARYGPALAPRPDFPRDLSDADLRAAVDEWIRPVQEYRAAVEAAIEADIMGTGARFAAYATRCCFCGRALRDPKSRSYGVGPECGDGLGDEFMAAMAARVGAAIAEAEIAEAESEPEAP
jgi:hypothetical protein